MKRILFAGVTALLLTSSLAFAGDKKMNHNAKAKCECSCCACDDCKCKDCSKDNCTCDKCTDNKAGCNNSNAKEKKSCCAKK